MTVSFFVEETLSDLTAWFIRCWDGTIREDKEYPYEDDNTARKAMNGRVRKHNQTCNHCSQDKPAALEVTSRIEAVEDLDISDIEIQAVFDALALNGKTFTKRLYGFSDASNLQGRIILALALIEENGKGFSEHISNKKLLSYLHQLYEMTLTAIRYEREIVWLEYP